MEKKNYFSPQIKTVKFTPRGVILGSGGQQGTDTETYTGGGSYGDSDFD